MREHHPDPEALSRFVLGELSDIESAEIERHLKACPDCRDKADETMDLMSLPFLDRSGSGYDEAFDRALVGVAEKLAGLGREVRSADDLLAELLREPAAGRQRKIREEERFHSLKLCQLLRTRSRDCWFSDLAVARDLAELAVGVAEHLVPERYGAMMTADARALSWAYLGNSLRIASDAWRAERAFRQAWSHHRQGSGDLDTEGELLIFTSSLRIHQGRFDEARQIADRAIAVYRALGDDRREGATLIKKGKALKQDCQWEEAITATRLGLLRIGTTEDPKLLLIGKHNLARSLVECGRIGEAAPVIEEIRPLCGEIGDSIMRARIDWLEGSFASHIGGFAQAESRLNGSLNFFLHHGNGIDVCEISLELAQLYARAAEPRKVKEVLREMIPLGEAMGLERETLAARMLYAQVSER